MDVHSPEKLLIAILLMALFESATRAALKAMRIRAQTSMRARNSCGGGGEERGFV